MKQFKESGFKYYISSPLKRTARRVRENLKKMFFPHRWYCDGCKTYHSGRVVAFFPCRDCDGVCGKHITPEEAKKCEEILLGGFFGRSVKQRILGEIQQAEVDSREGDEWTDNDF